MHFLPLSKKRDLRWQFWCIFGVFFDIKLIFSKYLLFNICKIGLTCFIITQETIFNFDWWWEIMIWKLFWKKSYFWRENGRGHHGGAKGSGASRPDQERDPLGSGWTFWVNCYLENTFSKISGLNQRGYRIRFSSLKHSYCLLYTDDHNSWWKFWTLDKFNEIVTGECRTIMWSNKNQNFEEKMITQVSRHHLY